MGRLYKPTATRGLLVSGSGETEYDALYDLLGSLSIIPTSGPFFLRLASFVMLTLLARIASAGISAIICVATKDHILLSLGIIVLCACLIMDVTSDTVLHETDSVLVLGKTSDVEKMMSR